MEETILAVKIGQVYRIKDLKGTFGKHLDVPEGYHAVVNLGEGNVKVFPPGQRQVLKLGQRVSGKSTDFRCAMIADGPFSLVADVPHAMSGDGELVDVVFGMGLEMIDPVQVFHSALITEDGSLIPDVDSSQLRVLIQPILRQYTTQDLALNLPGERLLAEIGARVQLLFANSGLRMLPIHWIAVSPAGDRVQIAAKLQQLEEKLNDVEVEKKLAAAETEAELKTYLGEVEPGLEKVSVRVGPAMVGQTDRPFKRWMAGAQTVSKARSKRPTHLLKQLFSKQKPTDEANPTRIERPRIPRRWWLSIVLSMFIFLVIGLTLTYLVKILTEGAQRESQLEIYIAIWAAIIAIELDAAKRLYEKREQLAEALWAHPDKSHLDILARNNRQRADALVRQQSATVIGAILEKFENAQSRIFDSGKGDVILAKKIRDLRNRIEDKKRQLQDRVFGVPAYMTDLNVTWPAWLSMLDYDEDLLLHFNALDEEAFQLQEKVADKTLSAEMLDKFEQDLDFCVHRFSARSRAVKD